MPIIPLRLPTPYALGLLAITLWASLATLAVRLTAFPPLLLTGLGLILGALVGLLLCRGDLRQWCVPPATLALGVAGLFGYHFLLFMALRLAPPLQANLLNYLWPLGMVVLAPLFLPAAQLRPRHGLAALLGFSGAGLAIHAGAPALAAQQVFPFSGLGYALALAAALVWSSYSLLCKKIRPFPTAAIGGFALVASLLSLACSWWLEDWSKIDWQSNIWQDLLLIGLGPLGLAFYAWDAALKTGDVQRIGVLAFLTPLLSTLLLSWSQGFAPSRGIWLAAGLIVLASWIAARPTTSS